MTAKKDIFPTVRPPAVAGSFYPADAGTLRGEISALLASSASSGVGGVIGLVAPHAGYYYSGALAARSFNAVRGLPFDTVVFLATAHSLSVKGAALYPGTAFSTPLGDMEIDKEVCDILRRTPLIADSPAAHAPEHSIEVQLPFLQGIGMAGIRIVPLLLNTHDIGRLAEIGDAVAAALKGRRALVVVSTDWSHYPPSQTARRADLTLIAALQSAVMRKDMEFFQLAHHMLLERGETNLDTVCCGAAAVTAGAFACIGLGAKSFRLLEYRNSGEVEGGSAAQCVGYASGVFSAEAQEKDPVKLSREEGAALLSLARRSIKARLEGKALPRLELSDSPALNLPGAPFVTLTMDGNLRGCIGNLEPRQILQDAVASLAVSSAFEDPRFDPLSPAELDSVRIEISVLSPLRKASGHEEVVPGLHGVVISDGARRGTYLPQVWEHFRKKEDFLSSLCAEKAGLSSSAWKDGSAEIWLYTVDAFTE